MNFVTGCPSRILPVPYFLQPTPITCQSTCLKMMALYLEQSVVLQSTGAGERDIGQIWKDINESPDRPSKIRNAHVNLKWWLERHFPSIKFTYETFSDEARAGEQIVHHINNGMPVLMSVSHARVAGHIVLVVGYENLSPFMSAPDFHIVVHDPYGRFDPSLQSSLFGVTGQQRGLQGGMSLVNGGELGPGRQCRLPITGVSRNRKGDSHHGTYYLLTGRR